jgi:chromosome partitioning protein
MGPDNGSGGNIVGIESDVRECARDEHPSVVMRDMARRRRGNAHVIVFANEKGGVGKSTFAFHCAVALAHLDTRVLALDCDGRQQTLNRLLEARDATVRTLKLALPQPRHAVIDRQSGASLVQEIERVGSDCDFVLIDLPGHDSPLARRVIALADTLVTPVNSSPTDLDALGSVDPIHRRFRHAGPFAEVVKGLRQERLARECGTLDWIVARNRIRRCERRLIASVDRNLATLARNLDFRTIDGLSERLAYRELLPFGLTQHDLRLIPQLGAGRGPALRELHKMIEELRLPQPNSHARRARSPHVEAPVLARAEQKYREALYAATPVQAVPA